MPNCGLKGSTRIQNVYATTPTIPNEARNAFLRKCEREIKTVSAESTEQQRGNIHVNGLLRT